MLNFEPNYFQRSTQLLGREETRQQIILMYKISKKMQAMKFNQAITYIEQFFKFNGDNSIYYLQDHIMKEMELMLFFCYYQTQSKAKFQELAKKLITQINQLQFHRIQHVSRSITIRSSGRRQQSSYQEQLYRSYPMRLITFFIFCNVQRVQFNIKDQMLRTKLISLLQYDNYLYLPEFLGTLTGCKYLKYIALMKDIAQRDLKKKAQKLQLLAGWKYMTKKGLLGQSQQYLQLKESALYIWQQLNSLVETKNCQDELKQLKSKKGPYVQKLNKIRYFIEPLYDIQYNIDEINKQTLIKWNFPTLLNNLQEQKKIQLIKKSSINEMKQSMLNSNPKKKQLQYIKYQCTSFYGKYKGQINSQITNLIQNSAFLDEQIKIVRKKLLIIFKAKKYFYKIFIMNLQEYVNKKQKYEKNMRNKNKR